MRFRLTSAVLAAAFVLPVLPACGEKKKKSEIRAEEGATCLKDVLEARRKRLASGIPAEDESSSDEHPWLAWIKKGVTVSPASDIRACGVKGKGSPAEEQSEVLARFFETQRDYFLSEKAVPNEYASALLGAQRVSAGQPWEADIAFDALFFHAAELARTWTLFASEPRDDRVTRFFTYWKYAFDFKPETSIYEEEVNKLCAQKLGEFCKKLPMEDRPYLVMKPYFEAVAKQAEDFQAKHAASPFAGLAGRIAARFKERAGKVPTFDEYPVLPAIRSTVPAPYTGNAVLMVTDKGVSLMDNALRLPNPPPPQPGEQPKPPWKPDFSAQDPKLAEDVSKLVQDVRSSTMSAYNQSTIYVVPQAEVPVGYLEPLMRATIVGDNAKEWPTMTLVGRRRADNTNRRAGFTITLTKPDKVVPFKLKAPKSDSAHGGKTLTCTAWAAVGKDQLEAKGFRPVVWHDGKQVHTGRLTDDGTIDGVQGAAPHGDGDRLETWTDGQNASIVVAVPQSATYAQWLEALNGVALKCDKDECSTARSVPVFLATCR